MEGGASKLLVLGSTQVHAPRGLSPRTAAFGSALAALAVLVPAASAEGATWCVHDPACVAAGGTNVTGPPTGATIQSAFAAANNGDRVELGAVTFTDVNITGASKA